MSYIIYSICYKNGDNTVFNDAHNQKRINYYNNIYETDSAQSSCSRAMSWCLIISLLQLDANLIEGEPYCITASHNKKKRRQKWRDRIQIHRKYGKPVFKARQNKRHQCGARTVVMDTKFFSTVKWK